jgi:CubicO group peptidase (beta-lactamase class C family)
MKLLLKLSVVLLVFQGLTPCAHGAASIDEQISQINADQSGVGLAAWSVNGNGDLCSIGSAGERIKDSGEEFIVTGDSRHHIGSVTKSMTAVLLAILINDGTIPNGWDSLLQSVLPMATNTAYENVTLRELCGMLSGIPENPLFWWIYGQQEPQDIRAQRRLAAADALQSTPVHTPGSAFLYSNWGFVLAGHIVEELTDLSWEENLRTRLFSPLGIALGNAPCFADFTGAPNNNVDPWGHSGTDQTPCNPATSPIVCDFPPVVTPAGLFSGPLAAMAKYFAWHVACHNGSYSNDTASTEQNLLPQEACRELHQPANASLGEYGYGWVCTTREWANGLTCTHSGSNTLNMYIAWLAFGIDRAFVGFTNGAGRPSYADFVMVDAAVVAAIVGEQDCQDRILSDAYSTPVNASTSPQPSQSPLQNCSFTGIRATASRANGIHSMGALFGGVFVGMMLLL